MDHDLKNSDGVFNQPDESRYVYSFRVHWKVPPLVSQTYIVGFSLSIIRYSDPNGVLQKDLTTITLQKSSDLSDDLSSQSGEVEIPMWTDEPNDIPTDDGSNQTQTGSRYFRFRLAVRVLIVSMHIYVSHYIC